MTTDNYDYSAYVGVGHNGAPEELLEVTKLAEATLAAQTKVEKLEGDLKTATQDYRSLAEKKLPEAMELLGMSSFTTTSDISIEVSEKIRASLAPENRPKAFTWLEENGYGGIIKSEVVVVFKRHQIDEAKKFADELRQKGYLANLERKIEPSTLTAFIKENLAQGKDIPLDIFGVFRQRIAKVEV